MKLSAGTIGTVLFTAAGIAVFVLMAKRTPVEGFEKSALNFGMPMPQVVAEEAPQAVELEVAPATTETSAVPETTMETTAQETTTPVATPNIPATSEPIKTEEMPQTDVPAVDGNMPTN